MPGTGGSYRDAIPAVDAELLQDVVDLAVTKFKDKAFCFEEYDEVTATQACSGSGLLHCKWWLEKLLPLCNGAILPLQLKAAIRKHAVSHNKSKYKHDLWAANQASKVCVVLKHWRRLKNSLVRKRQAMQKLGKARQESLEALLALSPGLKACNKAKGSSAKEACNKARSPSPSKEACNKAKDMTSGQKKVSAAKSKSRMDISPVSMDSDGFPKMLAESMASLSGLEENSPQEKLGHNGLKQSPGSGQKRNSKVHAQSSGLKKSQSSSQKSAALPLLSKRAEGHRQSLQAEAAAAMDNVAEAIATKTKEQKHGEGTRKKPACAKRPATNLEVAGSAGKKRRLETKPDQARGLETQPEAMGLETKPVVGQHGWEKHKAEKYTQQSYIRGYWNGKWHLLVACSEKQAADYPGGHHAVIDALQPLCQEPGMTKQKLLEQRAALLKKEA